MSKKSPLVVIAILLSMVASRAQAQESVLSVWSFTEETRELIEHAPEGVLPSCRLRSIPAQDIEAALTEALKGNGDAPDVFTLEESHLRRFVESGDLLDLSAEASAIGPSMPKYLVDVASHDGTVYALSWLGTPGAFVYRRSLARRYLGSDDPAAVQAALADLPSFERAARRVRESSGGACALVSSTDEIMRLYVAARRSPWVVNGKLAVDPAMEAYLDAARAFAEASCFPGFPQWSEEWFSAMKGAVSTGDGSPVSVIGFVLPTWGVHYVIRPNCGETSGDWGVVAGPVPYFWGGYWLAARKGTSAPEAARSLIRFLVSDRDNLSWWVEKTGDCVSNMNVLTELTASASDPLLAGQNSYAVFIDVMRRIDGTTRQATDSVIEGAFAEAAKDYAEGRATREGALASFRAKVFAETGIR